jgi:hypothetical protein
VRQPTARARIAQPQAHSATVHTLPLTQCTTVQGVRVVA